MKSASTSRVLALACVAIAFLAGIRARAQSDSSTEEAIREAYRRGYAAGYRAGYEAGGGTVGHVPGRVANSPRPKGGSTSGRDIVLEFDAGNARWTLPAAAAPAIDAPATLEDIKKLGATDTTIVLEDFPVRDLAQLEEAFKNAKKAKLQITPQMKKATERAPAKAAP